MVVTRIFLCLACVAVVLSADDSARPVKNKDRKKDDISGPVVRATVDREKDSIILQANLSTDSAEKKKTIAQIIDEALEQEFPEDKSKDGKNYNETAKQEDATVETVIKVSSKQKEKEKEEAEPPPKTPDASPPPHKAKGWGWRTEDSPPPPALAPPPPKPQSAEAKAKPKDKGKHKVKEVNVESEVDRLIDSQDNVYVLSRPKDSAMGLILDPQLIRDLTVLITSSTMGGLAMEAFKQPIINGFFIAGSVVGPGGLKLVKELVQMESLAQVGVQLLLFSLGLEFSLSKLRAVRSVALVGGVLEIFLFIIVAGTGAHFIGASVHEGIFVGALVSMSSTSIVVKCLTDTKATSSPHGQITIGTLILQDCMVGLLFAFMPVLAGNTGSDSSSPLEIVQLVIRVTVSLGLAIAVAILLARTVLPRAVNMLAKGTSAELYQLSVLAFCLVCGWIFGHLGLSSELGAFVAGVMLSATEQQEFTLHQIESIKAFFLSLFVCSTGLVMSPVFLMQHLRILAGGVVLTIASKTLVISGTVCLFSYPLRTALAVGLSMAQIGEFAFVLLSAASQLGMLPYQVYMLLMGVTALSLLLTPFLMQLSSRLLQDGVPAAVASTLAAWDSKRRPRRTSSEALGEDGLPLRSSSGLLERAETGSPLTSRGRIQPKNAVLHPSEMQLNQRYPP